MSAYTDPSVKHDALLLFDAIDSNPNGDPDNSGKPRTDLDTGQGITSDASLKRKVRDVVQFQVGEGVLDASRFGIFIRRGVSLNNQLEEAYTELGQPIPKAAKEAKPEQISSANRYMREHFFDVRMFGAVMSTGKAPADRTTGPVTVGIARSFDPVLPMDLAITRIASTKEEDRDNASQMGNKTVVPYGLYAVRIHYQPTKDNLVDEKDLQVFWNALVNMFDLTRSAARPDIATRGLYVFSHDNALGNAPARPLLERIRVTRKDDVEIPAKFDDYQITVNIDDLPEGVAYTSLV